MTDLQAIRERSREDCTTTLCGDSRLFQAIQDRATLLAEVERLRKLLHIKEIERLAALLRRYSE